MLLFDKFAKCQNSHFFRIWVLQTFEEWCKGTCLTNAPVKWEPQFMSKLFAGTIHRGIFFLSCFRFWKFGLKCGMIGPWPKPQGACGPFDIWPPGGGIFYWLQKPNRGPKKFSLCLNSKSMREKREGGKGQNTVVRKDPPSWQGGPFSPLCFALATLPFLSHTFRVQP